MIAKSAIPVRIFELVPVRRQPELPLRYCRQFGSARKHPLAREYSTAISELRQSPGDFCPPAAEIDAESTGSSLLPKTTHPAGSKIEALLVHGVQLK